MKNLVFFSLLLIVQAVLAQFGPQQIVSNSADGTRNIFVIDIDGDTLPDVVSANKFGDNVTWFKNLDGSSFSIQLHIGNIYQTIDLFVADLDGDFDNDVLSLSGPDNLLVWYENLDGLGDFSNQKIISNTEDGAYTIIAADLDGDNDLDIVSGSDFIGLSWFENVDGFGNFGPKRVINSSTPNSRSVVAIDIDNDNDLDIVSSSSGSVTISWYENLDGLGTFGSQQIIAPSALTVTSIFAIDLDMDDDIDILAATLADDKLVWFENLDGQGNFSNEIIITTQADGITSVYAADLDNDDDIDVVHSSFSGAKIVWHENIDGIGDFSPEMLIDINMAGARDVFVADIDNDSDLDVFAGSSSLDKITWYENLTILAVEEHIIDNIKITPNPVENILYISSEQSVKSLKLYDLQGRLLLQNDTNTSSIDMSQLPSGLYLVEVTTDNGSLVKKVVKE